MKLYWKLNIEQRDKAVSFAEKELRSCVELGLISINKTDDRYIRELALIAAQESFYSEKGDVVVDDITDGYGLEINKKDQGYQE
jgi:hypothetical protein